MIPYIPSSTCPQDSQKILIISRRQLQPSAPSLGRLSTDGDGRFWASPAGLMSILTFSCPGFIGYKKEENTRTIIDIIKNINT